MLFKKAFTNKLREQALKTVPRKFQHTPLRTEREGPNIIKRFKQQPRPTTTMFTITTIAHKTDDSRHPLIVLTSRDGYKYLIGKVPEGSQRILNENKIKMPKLRGILLTGATFSWSEVGGIPGLFLTLSDSVKKSVDVYANTLFPYILSTWRYFVFRKGVELKVIENEKDGVIIADASIVLKKIGIEPKAVEHKGCCDSHNLSESSGTLSSPSKLVRQLKKVTSLMFPINTEDVNSADPDSYKVDVKGSEIHTHIGLPHPKDILPTSQQKSINYLCRFLPIRGKFDPVKAKSLGLKPGKDFLTLSAGTPVVNEAGVTITSDQVLSTPKSFKKLLIIDIPTNAYLENTLNSNEWFSFEGTGNEDIGVVYHFLGDEINYQSDEYQNFMKKFPEDCKHIISHEKLSNNTINFKRQADNIAQLKSILDSNFNIPNYENYQPLEFENIHKLQQNQQVIITPESVKHDESLIVVDKFEKSQPIPLDIKYQNVKDNVQIVTLGTGSAIPSLYRNVIATLLRIPVNINDSVQFKTILLDGGENTLGTMLRNFGHNNYEQLNQVFEELCMIHLSHLHADHHLGLISVINKWFEINQDKSKNLYLIVPWQYDHFMKEWYKLEAQVNELVDFNRIKYISCEEFLQYNNKQPEIQQINLDFFEEQFDANRLHGHFKRVTKQADVDLINQMFTDLNIESIDTVRAIHCAWAYSISITFKIDESNTFKVSYSGDTRPNPQFAKIGYKSDLLIHESSLDNDLVEEALAKKHSTMIEAVTVARLMHCPKLILTHFSSRYSSGAKIALDVEELTRLSDELSRYLQTNHENIFDHLENPHLPVLELKDLEICFAFDMMNVRLNTVDCQMGNFKQILKLVNAEEDAEKKEKELARQREKRDDKRNQRLEQKYKKVRQY